MAATEPVHMGERQAEPMRAAAPTYAEPPRTGDTAHASGGPRYAESARASEPMHSAEVARHAETPRYVEPSPASEPIRPVEPMRSMEGARYSEPAHTGPAIPVMPPVAPTGPVMDDLPPSAARPLSFLRNGGGAGATAMAPSSPAMPAYSAEDVVPSGPLMDGLPPTAARPLSFLRKNGGAQPPPAVPSEPPAGATPLSRTMEPAPTVRVTNVRKPEPLSPPEPPPYDDEDARYYPEQASPEGCASGECIPDEVPSEPVAASAPAAAPVSSTPAIPPATGMHANDAASSFASAPASHGAAYAQTPAASPASNGPGPNGHAATSSHGPAAYAPASGVAPASPAPGPNGHASTVSPTSRGPAAYAQTSAVPPPPAPRVPTTPPVAARPAFTPPAPAPRTFAPETDSEPDSEPTAAPPPVARGRDNPNLPLIERWRAAVESVKGASIRHGTALANGRLLSMRAGEIVLGFLPTAGLHKMAVSSAAGKATIDKALAEHFGRPVKLSFQDINPEDSRATLSLAEQDAQSRANHEKTTEGKVRGHPAIRAVLKFLGGEIEHIQVYEPERPSAVPAADTPDDSA
ncbi:DNA polymerase III subunit gamma/tau [Pyxidicoccus parkwayensis]|uniref:DNA polymerase III subunit gamma/tau n=1 Tax=Pyxidicoccus parkwayensis TaxID=2813578 RepID=A0ABX7NPF4_9BACT|nr:DNA polymerase III subunit gamma/tau [Pyxidicoccus parkwaysis]QSQ19402.1 DNA polymerase III subunit gamma/tau [Pyxidicoccus parkwaysis]